MNNEIMSSCNYNRPQNLVNFCFGNPPYPLLITGWWMTYGVVWLTSLVWTLHGSVAGVVLGTLTSLPNLGCWWSLLLKCLGQLRFRVRHPNWFRVFCLLEYARITLWCWKSATGWNSGLVFIVCLKRLSPIFVMSITQFEDGGLQCQECPASDFNQLVSALHQTLLSFVRFLVLARAVQT